MCIKLGLHFPSLHAVSELRHKLVSSRAGVGAYSWHAATVSEIYPFYRCFLYYWEQIAHPHAQRHTWIDIRYKEEKKIMSVYSVKSGFKQTQFGEH